MSMTAKPAACFAPKALPPEPPTSKDGKAGGSLAKRAKAPPPALDLIVNRSRWVEPRHGGTRQPPPDAMLARNDKVG